MGKLLLAAELAIILSVLALSPTAVVVAVLSVLVLLPVSAVVAVLSVLVLSPVAAVVVALSVLALSLAVIVVAVLELTLMFFKTLFTLLATVAADETALFVSLVLFTVAAVKFPEVVSA